MPPTPPPTPKGGDDIDGSSPSVQGDSIAQHLAKEQANEATTAAQRLERERVATCDAALARALEGQQEAVATAKERDDVAQHASDALACAAAERAAAATAVVPEPSGPHLEEPLRRLEEPLRQLTSA
jgi:ABC-type sugar transport system ATPase subunit